MVHAGKKIIARLVRAGIACVKCVFLMPPGCCRFRPTCTEFAAEAIETLPLYKAAPLIAGRLLKCHPFSAGGFDPVPQQSVRGKGNPA